MLSGHSSPERGLSVDQAAASKGAQDTRHMRNSGASRLPCQFYWLVGVISLLSSSPDYRGMANSIADLKLHERRK
jgi:hypothetical protein